MQIRQLFNYLHGCIICYDSLINIHTTCLCSFWAGHSSHSPLNLSIWSQLWKLANHTSWKTCRICFNLDQFHGDIQIIVRFFEPEKWLVLQLKQAIRSLPWDKRLWTVNINFYEASVRCINGGVYIFISEWYSTLNWSSMLSEKGFHLCEKYEVQRTLHVMSNYY